MEKKIIVYVQGGLVSAIYSTDPDTEVILYDQDNIDAGDPPPINTQDMTLLLQKATENCSAEIKEGTFYEIF